MRLKMDGSNALSKPVNGHQLSFCLLAQLNKRSVAIFWMHKGHELIICTAPWLFAEHTETFFFQLFDFSYNIFYLKGHMMYTFPFFTDKFSNNRIFPHRCQQLHLG